jgi:hypothetical protein
MRTRSEQSLNTPRSLRFRTKFETLYFSAAPAQSPCFNRRSPARSARGRDYFFAFLPVAVLASARRSVFLRRAARFFTLSLPWLFPIRPSPSPFRGGFQAISFARIASIFYLLLFQPHRLDLSPRSLGGGGSPCRSCPSSRDSDRSEGDGRRESVILAP